jgi:asparagine N-glycosylation enzyme membrane subunit Stt3
MLGKPQWFKRRKFTGWGLTPATWQGWVYIIALVAPFAVFQAFAKHFEAKTVILVGTIWAALLIVEVARLMAGLLLDERERLHEAMAERNALWAILVILVGGYMYRAAISEGATLATIDPLVLVAVVIGLAVKALTNIYLEKKN